MPRRTKHPMFKNPARESISAYFADDERADDLREEFGDILHIPRFRHQQDDENPWLSLVEARD